MRKAQTMPLNVIVIAIIVLVVLIVMIYIFTGRTQQFQKGISACDNCKAAGESCAEGEAKITRACSDADTEKGEFCCMKIGT